ncbi:MAG: hypothetical protein ACD_62C00241G0006 [uncultured bacterium]|nr:MAG: hypothetical protein ACD_62C00241G0006 [uncultured bacterium]
MRQEISQQTNLELTNNAHLNTHTEDTGALSWLIGDMVSHVLGDGLPPRPRQDWRNSDILSCMLEEFLKDMGEVPSLVAGQSRTKGTGEAVDAKPKFVVPYSPNDDYAKFKPLPFIDGLRKAQALDLPDPDMQEDDKNLSNLSYDKRVGSLILNGIEGDDVHQGQVGDCYFLAALSSLAETHPEFLEKNIQKNCDGTYTVGFHKITHPDGCIKYDEDGAYTLGIRTTKKITVDTELPKYGTQNLYARGESNNELWVALYEKAYAVYKGNDYDAIHRGNPAQAFYELVGVTSKTTTTSSCDADELYECLATAVKEGNPIVASSNDSADGTLVTAQNILCDHAYSVLGVKERNGTKYVQLRNPWGYKEWTGDGSDAVDDGTFWMPLTDFKSDFHCVNVLDDQGYENLYEPHSHPKKRV